MTNIDLIKQLGDLSNNGDLIDLISSKFNGEIRHTNERKDADTIITFVDMESTPNAQAIKEVVEKHYTDKGYCFKKSPLGSSEDNYATIIFVDGTEDLAYFVNITASYPLNGKHNHVRITTDFQ